MKRLNLTQLVRLAEEIGSLPPGIVPAPSTISQMEAAWENPEFQAGGNYIAAVADWAIRLGGQVLECGSGVTTLVLAALAGQNHYHLTCLEHDPFWSERVRQVVVAAGLKSATILTAELVDYGEYAWYGLPEPLPEHIDLVVCDGPPGSTKGGRYGLGPMAEGSLTEDSIVLLDDAQRDEERKVAERWQAEHGWQALGTFSEADGIREYRVLKAG